MTRRLELCWGTLHGAPLETLLAAAAAGGFGAVSATPAMYALASPGGRNDADLGRLMDDLGVGVSVIDPLISPLPGTPSPDEVGADYRHLFAATEEDAYRAAEALGARTINLAHFGGQAVGLDELADAVGGICGRAAARGLRVAIEFFPESAIPDLAATLRLLDAVGAGNAGIMLDTLHFTRSGGVPAEIADLRPGSVVALQVADRAAQPPGTPYVPMSGRLLPGDGELPLALLLAPLLASPPALDVGLEGFDARLAGLEPQLAAREAGSALRRLLAGLGPAAI